MKETDFLVQSLVCCSLSSRKVRAGMHLSAFAGGRLDIALCSHEGILWLRRRIGFENLRMEREKPKHPMLQNMVTSLRFEGAIGLFILLNAMSIGIDASYVEGDASKPAWTAAADPPRSGNGGGVGGKEGGTMFVSCDRLGSPPIRKRMHELLSLVRLVLSRELSFSASADVMHGSSPGRGCFDRRAPSKPRFRKNRHL